MQDLISSETKKIRVEFQDWGMIDYQEAWDKQEALFTEIVNIKSANRTNNTENSTKNYLIFCEHPAVYTLGKSGKMEHLLLDEKGLLDNHARFYKINRGRSLSKAFTWPVDVGW